MTKDEALRLALEALEKISRTQYHIETPPIESLEEKMRRIADQAITTIKAALEAKDEPVGYFSVNDYGNWEENESNNGIPLYTTPPQRTWVGLTNDELTDLFYNTNLGQQSAVGQAIALLKERNT